MLWTQKIHASSAGRIGPCLEYLDCQVCSVLSQVASPPSPLLHSFPPSRGLVSAAFRGASLGRPSGDEMSALSEGECPGCSHIADDDQRLVRDFSGMPFVCPATVCAYLYDQPRLPPGLSSVGSFWYARP